MKKQLAGGSRYGVGGLALLMLTAAVSAEVTATGDVSPDPTIPLLVFGQRLQVGEDALGTVRVDGGSVLETNSGTLGRDPGGRGEVTISGTGSAWEAQFDPAFASMTIGRDGEGVLAVLDGGRLASGHGRIAAEVDGSGQVFLDGMGSEWVNLGISVGERALGTLMITNGAESTSDGTGRIGDDDVGQGRVTVSGSGSAWRMTRSLQVGDDGDGTLEILGGGAVENTSANVAAAGGATGMATVDGAGSTWANSDSLRVGTGGVGTLDVTDGGRVTSVNFASLGQLAGASGRVTIDGVGSVWEHDGDLTVGDSGTGELNVTMGGRVINAQGNIGFTPSIGVGSAAVGVVTVSGANSQWSNSENLFVGNFGEGSLTINTGGVVDAANMVVALDGPGDVEVSGSGSLLAVREDLLVGGVPDDDPAMPLPVGVGDGMGEVLVQDRAEIRVDAVAAIGVGPGSQGFLTVTDSAAFRAEGGMDVALGDRSRATVSVTGRAELIAGGGMTIGVGDNSRGELILDDRGTDVVVDGDLRMAIGADSVAVVTLTEGTLDLEGHDILRGPGTARFDFLGGDLRDVGLFGIDLSQEGGLLAAGNSPGTMVIGGDYTQGPNAALELELAGLGGQAGVDFDFYEVQGDAHLSGTVSVLADGGFNLTQPASFDFLAASSIDVFGLTLDGPAGATLGVFDDGLGGQVLRLTLVPEPLSGTVLFAGCAVFAVRHRRRRAA